MRGAWAAALLIAPSAWGQTGAIAGVVVDKEHNRPLAGASVRLDGTDQVATTDSNGLFELQGVPTGTHRLTWHHATLDSLGLTMQSVAFDVRPNDTVTVSLAKPSPRALTAVFCGKKLSVLAVGRITGLDNGEPVAGVAITTPGGNATTDSVGRYHLCLEPGFAIVIHAHLIVDAYRYLLPSPAEHVVFADLRLAAPPEYASATVSGRVVSDSGAPLNGAGVSVLGMQSRSAGTDDDGRFQLERLPAGTQVLIVRKLGWDLFTETVELSAHTPYTPTVVMRPKPPTLAQVNVVATPDQLADTYKKIGFSERKRIGIGRFLTQDDIKRAAGVTTGDALNGYGGIWIGDNGDHGINGPAVDSHEQRLHPCTLYIVDGQILGEDDLTRGLPPPEQVIGIEIYRQGEPKPIPVSFGADACAEVLVWTKAELTQ